MGRKTLLVFIGIALLSIVLVQTTSMGRSCTNGSSEQVLHPSEYAVVRKFSGNEEDPNLTLPLYDNR